MDKLKIIVAGRVQGVNFRRNCQKKAQELTLAGYAKNMPDTSVEIVLQGEPAAIENFLNWLPAGHKHAQVKRIKKIPIKDDDIYRDFATF